jgi:hypothetical protein
MNTKLFLPVLHNGDGSVKLSYMMSVVSSFGGIDIHISTFGDSHPGRARNRAVAKFLETDRDYLLFIDADIVFDREHIEKLMASDEPILCGIYPKKQPGIHPCCVMLPGFQMTEETKDCPVEGRRAGTGFMRIHRSVFERLKASADEFRNTGGDGQAGPPQWDFFKSGVLNGEWLSEDWYFCDMARAAGFRIMIHTGIQARHEGSAVYPLPQTVPVTCWRDIHGWFTDEDAKCYEHIADHLPAESHFAEIGVWLGRSLGAMATFCRERGKKVSLYAVDTFEGTPGEEDAHAAIVAENGGSNQDTFIRNMRAIGVNGELNVRVGESIDAAEGFQDESLDAVFIDARHEYGAVRSDILAWRPKVKQGGIIAGHDYDYPTVFEAVQDTLGSNVKQIGRCWLVEKK